MLRSVSILLLTVLVSVLAWWWRESKRAAAVRATIPPQPSLVAFPAELGQRVAFAEQHALRGNVEALADLAELYHANGFFREAARCYYRLADLEPARTRWLRRLASLRAIPPDACLDEIYDECYDLHRLAEAAGRAERAGDPAQAQRLVERAVQLDPKNPATLFQSGALAFARRDFSKAQQAFEACVAVAPDRADAWVSLVHVATARGDADAATRALASGLARCPDSPALHAERAGRLAAIGRDAEALGEYQIALRFRPDDAETLVGAATICFRLGHDADGLATLQRALAAAPEHPAALTLLASHAIRVGDENGAVEWLRRMRDQPRVPLETNGTLAEEFHRRFGRSP